MLFNSLEFGLFLPITFLVYWFFVRTTKNQNYFILIVSYVFYGWWDWRFLFLILFSSIVDFYVGKALSTEQNQRKRKALLSLSILVNLGFLGFLKYYNFFTQSFADAFQFLGQPINISSLNIILPVGISFYTFQTLSYSIDVYRSNLKPTHDLIAFLAFVSFFPQLVAGPIERATNLLPQFYSKRKFNLSASIDGMRQILFGLFKKMVIADNCAVFVNDIFGNYADYSGSTLLIGAIFFSFQIYCDFSGYSDIAIGTARLFGFNLMRNFAFPYFSRDVAEFWRRWHISLSTWFRDYLYIPLGGSIGGLSNKIRNTLIIFLVSGFWHGANWTFIFWGLLNALYFLPLLLAKKNRKYTDTISQGKLFSSFKEILLIVKTFLLTTFAWIFFRAESLSDAFEYIKSMFSETLLDKPQLLSGNNLRPLIVFILGLVIVEWIQREKQHALNFDGMKLPKILRWGIYYGIIFIIIIYGGSQQEFIYFQF